MSAQLTFAFVGDRSEHGTIGRTNNLFLALKPPAGVALAIHESVANCHIALGRHMQRVPEARLHISLVSFGAHPAPSSALIDAIERRMAGFVSPSITIGFDRLASFGGNAVVLFGGGASQILELRRNLLRRIAFPVKGAFEPHMTLFYSPQRIAGRPVPPILWNAGEVVLIHSNHGHQKLAGWRLEQKDQLGRHESTPAPAGRPADMFGGSGR